MKQYLDLLRAIRDGGQPKHPSRAENAGSGHTKNATIGLPNLHFSHDLDDGFPLLTTRALNFRGMVGELRAFLDGCDNHVDFVERGCGFWKPWAREDGDLGPVYGAQWHRFGQIDHVLRCLRERPTDRRMVVSAWLPDQIPAMVLPPCHLLWVVTPYGRRLNLAWVQRSCDFPVGVPYNIASYALLTHVLARWAGMKPGNLSAIFCDAHIYENQAAGVDEQLAREPGELPSLDVRFADAGDFRSWHPTLAGWRPQPNIDFGELEV